METKRKILNCHRKGDGIRKISREFNIARNTVREIIRSHQSKEEVIVPSYFRSVQTYPSLGKHIANLEKLLRENKNAKPKRTTVQIYEELCLQGFKGSYSSVSRYASKWKKITDTISPLACVPLSFAPGEAYQFDWSTDEVIINDEVISVKVAHFVLCYSGKKFVYIYPNETHEMVFDAHIKAFKFFGGTPVRGIYDNMKTAVQKVLKGKDRQWNPKFEHLCAHYMITPTACTPARGNEKGRVERQVAIDRSEFFTPMPKVQSLSELNDRLMSQLIHYNNTHKHPKHQYKTIDEVFEEESHCLMPTPVMFDGCKEISVKVSTTCLAQYDRNYYSVDCSCASQIVQCKSYADKIVFVYNGKEVGRHERKFTKGQTYYDYQHYLPILARKPGALRNGAPFINMDLPDELNKVRKALEKQENGSRDFAHILSYIPVESIESVIDACSYALEMKAVSKDVILNALFRRNELAIQNTKEENQGRNLEEDPEYLELKYVPEENCSSYDQLLSAVSIQDSPTQTTSIRRLSL
jgi:transposase